LLTQKGADLILFQKAVEIIKNKNHLTREGLSLIINIISSMNWGLTEIKKLKISKFKSVAVDRPKIITNKIPDPNWIAGVREIFMLIFLNQNN
jgi:hypothetical protein